jgi:putative Mn2+ efflux pump MntP
MNLLDIILLAVALAMDCFAVSIVSGVIVRARTAAHDDRHASPILHTRLRMAFLFGFFQALMPLIGWLGISWFSRQLEAYDHWIAFVLLAFIGGNMIREAFSPEEEQHFNPHRLRTQLLLAVATSIDALAVGVSFACMGYRHLSQLMVPLPIIAVVSFLFSLLGTRLGLRFGGALARRLKPGILGGIILILIGVKILVSHLWGVG